jgi:hypothetical protein
MKTTIKRFYQQKRGNGLVWFPRVVFILSIMMLLTVSSLHAQISIAGSTWDLASSTGPANTVTGTQNSGFKNWGSGVFALTDTVTNSGNCRGSEVTETNGGAGYDPTTNFSQCFKVFFGCPGLDTIGSSTALYKDHNADGMAFSFWKNNATFSATQVTYTCGGGLGYDNAVAGGDGDGAMITIEFDTYSSLGLGSTPAVDGYYGGGAPGSGLITDELSIHVGMNSNDLGLINTPPTGSTVNAGNLEDGKEHQVCITYSATSPYLLGVTIDGVSKLSYDLGATYNFVTYFGAGKKLNYTWSAGEYGSNNYQMLGPSGSNLFGTIGSNPCTNVVMPVSLLDFTGEMANEAVLLNWATANETNNAKFVIERSTNSYDWETIGEVAGAENSISTHNYNFIDYNPVEGTVYYRLRQVDVNGSFAYSKIINVNTAVLQASVNIMPNPFEDALIIQSNLKENLDISIHDILGQLVYHTNQKNDNGTLRIQPDNLTSGAYMITIQTDSFIKQQKIIRK